MPHGTELYYRTNSQEVSILNKNINLYCYCYAEH